MVMEALEGYSQMIRYEIMVSHSLNSIESSNVLYDISNHHIRTILIFSVTL